MNRKISELLTRGIVAALALTLVAVLAVRFVPRQRPESRRTEPSSANDRQSASPSPRSSPGGPNTMDLLEKTQRTLTSARETKTARTALEELRGHLTSLPRGEASLAVQRMLDSRADARTGLEFKVGADRTLAQAPTLRCFLLDQLARLDPAAAAAYAEKILSSPDSPDEWALSLRNYAAGRNGAEGREFLQQKFREMIAQDSWRHDPSVGFLEAFDVAVHAGGTELLPDLTALLRDKENQAVAHAAYLALDRLTINEPATILAQLEQQPDSMSGREATRANFFARADVGEPQQRAVLESYLLNPRLSQAELETFAGLYPNANYMISQNLLTQVRTPDRNTLVQGDRRALEVVQQWLADSRFARLQPQLEKIRQRLEIFVGQADANKQ